ncbi:unnamed protein product [Arabis nemorensis]|uniref:Ubiquitin-like protease family profile domain-containing protein n=1 Tax=Arabis nemorensis TaxID=586526 RepID=A0A565ATI3_9BRAS|nr:unnamed protein product [Arabis nemorensis]
MTVWFYIFFNLYSLGSLDSNPNVRRRGNLRKSTLPQPCDTPNQGYGLSSEEEDNDSSSNDDYKPRKSGKRRVQIPESSDIGSQQLTETKVPIRRRGRQTKKRGNKRAKKGVKSSQPLGNVHQISALSSNDKDKALSSTSHDININENGSEEIKGNKPLVVESGGSDIRQTKIENHVERLEAYLQDHERTDEEMDIKVLLISMDEQTAPNLENSQLTCGPDLTLKSICEAIAPYIGAQDEEIELYVVKEFVKDLKNMSIDKVESVNKEQNVGGLRTYNCNYGYVLLGYRKIASSE